MLDFIDEPLNQVSVAVNVLVIRDGDPERCRSFGYYCLRRRRDIILGAGWGSA
jgi:hypothetical protein